MTTRSIKTLLFAVAILTANGAQAQTMRPMLDFETADRIRNACLAHASDSEYGLAIAVFDHGGRLVSFARADGATPATSAVAEWKGLSASIYLTPSSVTATWPDAAMAPMLATIGGGVPIFTRDGVGIGGVGVSGAPVPYDIECATVGIEAAGLLAARP